MGTQNYEMFWKTNRANRKSSELPLIYHTSATAAIIGFGLDSEPTGTTSQPCFGIIKYGGVSSVEQV